MRKINYHSRLIVVLTLLITTLFGCATIGCSKPDDGSIGHKTIVETNIPDKSGMTIKGKVACNGVGIAGVMVSDGIEVTTTDAAGVYYLPSKKKYGYVFISTPSGYEVPLNGNVPEFFLKVNKSKPTDVEQKDFNLTLTNNSKHAVLAMADFHLAKRTNDLMQFQAMADDINNTILNLRNQGYMVYGVSLGDESWDLFWYDNNFSIIEAFQQTRKINCPFYHCMGNHDNDPYYANDWQAAQKFINSFPAYYSFNIGDVHYIVMDNIEYLNNGAYIGHIGERNYNVKIISEEMQWLKKDLALVKDKTKPLVIAMHAPLYGRPLLKGTQQSYSLDNANDFVELIKEFTDVHVLSGHTHDNYNIGNKSNIREHNTGAICATWWWTGKLTNDRQHICCDGTPGGYGVYLSDNAKLSWYYKSKGFDKDYQFRTYDLNTTYISDSDIKDPDGILADYAHGYNKKKNNNEVLINVWNYDENWKVEVYENNNLLQVERIDGYDPLHILSYEVQRISAGKKPTKDFVTTKTTHLFKVKASNANSTLNIKVTDSFGRVYTEEMIRPKTFNLMMY